MTGNVSVASPIPFMCPLEHLIIKYPHPSPPTTLNSDGNINNLIARVYNKL